MKLEYMQRLLSASGRYRVAWEIRARGVLMSDHTPERGEDPFDTVDEAWAFAEQMAMKLDSSVYVNIYVIDAETWTPVPGYRKRMMNPYPRESR